MAIGLPEFDTILLDLCRASARTSDEGNDAPACDQLMRDVVAHDREQFVQQLTQSPGRNEYRLNGDGLKLQYEVEFYRDGDDTNIYLINLRIGGDQADEYPEFIRAAQPILEAANGTASATGAIRRAA